MIRNILLTLALHALLLHTFNVSGQSSGRKTVQQSSIWLVTAGNVRLHRVFGIQGDAIVRLSDFKANQQHEFHLAADLYVNDHLIITPLGYGYFLNYIYGGQPAAVRQNEHRLWQQIVYKTNIHRVGLQIRLRAEEDWKEKKIKNTDGRYYLDGYTFKPRLRPRFMVNVALNHHSMSAPKTVYLSMWQEMYIAVGPKVTYHLPEENRAYVGVGYKATKWASIGMGYMHQLIIRSNGAQAESNHTMVVQAVFDIDGRKHPSTTGKANK